MHRTTCNDTRRVVQGGQDARGLEDTQGLVLLLSHTLPKTGMALLGSNDQNTRCYMWIARCNCTLSQHQSRSKGARPSSKVKQRRSPNFWSAVTEVGHAFSSGGIRRFLQEHGSLRCGSMSSYNAQGPKVI